jgi:uncharacterized membrane protein YkvA (DUF1232 family)
MTLFAGLRSRARALKTQTLALSLAYRDPRTPWYAKAWGALVVAYALSPIDLIPDFIPILGYLDDLILVPAGIALAIRLIPPQVLAEAQAQARALEGEPRPRKWLAAVVIVFLWAGCLAWVGWTVYRLWRG